MTIFAIHNNTGALVSVGSVIANPLPDGLTAVALSAADAQSMREGTGTWDAALRAVVPAPVDPAVSNEQTINSRVQTHIDGLQAIKGSSGTLTGAQLSNAARANAAAILDLMRVVHRKLDAVD